MSMTREETITNLEKLAALFYTESEQSKMVDYSKIIETLEFAAAALRPVSREQVEKAEWIWSTGDVYTCSSCGEKTHVDECMENPIYNFCPFCMAPMTDEAVDMVMERLEALHSETKTD